MIDTRTLPLLQMKDTRNQKMQQLMHHTKEGKYICICHVVGGKKSSKHSEMKQILLTAML